MFLTGSNMAGKSTFLKAISLCIYLAHLGFPVPAAGMRTSVLSGMMTTINLSDNINKGYSHFLNEVKRVKAAALKLKETEKLFIVFDELFRGTNVQDAYQASVMIINALSKIKTSFIIISTHLIEIAAELKADNVEFMQLYTSIENTMPVFRYKIRPGISTERLGMVIVQNEGIIDILDQI